MSLLSEMSQKAFDLGVPISVHLDVTYRCNERCVHCYLDHDDHGEMTTAEIKGILDQLADAGVFFLIFSGGEVFLRRDFFELLEYARRLLFNVKIKTNGVMIREWDAQRLRAIGIDTVQISVYSHLAEVHDAITKLPGSFVRTMKAIRFLRDQGLKVTIANVLMTPNLGDQYELQRLAVEMGVHYTVDPTITPKIDGDTSILSLRIPGEALREVFRNPALVPNMEEFCAPPKPVTEEDLEGYSCSAGHSFCYISPYGDVFPCVQFPLPSGNLRRQKFLDIWNHSPELNEVRSIQAKDLSVCSSCSHVATCSRCPGLAYMEGNMRGPSTADCEKSFHRTGIPSANMLRRQDNRPGTVPLVQIQPLPA
jgi:radical SAM protein with 4Fe4S-binding SPASM domain